MFLLHYSFFHRYANVQVQTNEQNKDNSKTIAQVGAPINGTLAEISDVRRALLRSLENQVVTLVLVEEQTKKTNTCKNTKKDQNKKKGGAGRG